MKKKPFVFILIATLLITFSGCSSQTPTTTGENVKMNDVPSYDQSDDGIYKDTYSGISFKLPKGFKVIDSGYEGETLLKNNKVDGCVFTLMYDTTETLKLTDVKYNLIFAKREMNYYINHHRYDTAVYSYGETDTRETIGDKQVLTEEDPELTLNGLTGYDLQAKYYHFLGPDGQQCIVGYVGYAHTGYRGLESKDTKKLEKTARQIVADFNFYDAGAHKDGEASDPTKARLTKSVFYKDISFRVPEGWQDMSFNDQGKVYKASRAKNSLFEDAAVTVSYFSSSQLDGAAFPDFDSAQYYSTLIGGSVLQYPDTIESGITTLYDEDDTATVKVLGQKVQRRLVKVDVDGDLPSEEIPYQGYIERRAYLYLIKHQGECYLFSFSFNGIDTESMKTLSRQILSTIEF